jgi:hypothetical protein
VLVVLLALFSLSIGSGQDQPPAITHPEFYYGFVGIATAWQVAFVIIGRDPERYRPLSWLRFWKSSRMASP